MLMTAFGLGLIKPAPGTWGSLPPVALGLALVTILHLDGWSMRDVWMVNGSLLLLGLIFAIACVRFGDEAERSFDGKDPSQVVADEVAGQSVALLGLPWFWDERWWWNILLAAVAFLTFRFFDIVKVPPAKQLQSIRGGWGILADDLVAGVYALILTQAVARVVLPAIV